MKRYVAYIKPYLSAFLLAPLLMLTEVFGEILLPKFMSMIINNGVADRDTGYIIRMGIIMVLTAIVMAAGGIGGAYFSAKASICFTSDLRDALFAKVQNFSFKNIDQYSTGSLVTRLTNDVQQVQNVTMMGLRLLFRAPGMLIGALIMAFLMNAKLALVILIVIPFLSIAIVTIMVKAFPRFTLMQKKIDKLNSGIQEALTNVRVIKSFVREDHEIQKFSGISEDIYRDFSRAEKRLAFNMPLMQFCMYACLILVSWFGARMIVSQTLTTGQLMSLMTYAIQILSSLMMLSMVFVMITISRASCERIVEILDEESDIVSPADAVTEVTDGSIDFDHVSFSYSKREDKCCLEDVDLHIPAGMTVGILGGTGSAKSSLVQLIPRLYDATIGTVKVGGVDVRQYDVEKLREEVAMVLQKNVLFSGTIKENLRWGDPNATDEEMQRVCRLAHADEFIQTFPDGYDTYIEQGGSNVSGGQKQRLCIARALLKKPKILILDDSTSAVDTHTDACIRQALRDEIPDTTKIIIAQRVTSLMDADKIIVMDEGRVDGVGTHEELLQSNAIYREVYESQQKGSVPQ